MSNGFDDATIKEETERMEVTVPKTYYCSTQVFPSAFSRVLSAMYAAMNLLAPIANLEGAALVQR